VCEAVDHSPGADHVVGARNRSPGCAGTLERVVGSARNNVGLCFEPTLLETLCMAVDGGVQFKSGRGGVASDLAEGGRCLGILCSSALP
jgi:hypothetical protein